MHLKLHLGAQAIPSPDRQFCSDLQCTLAHDGQTAVLRAFRPAYDPRINADPVITNTQPEPIQAMVDLHFDVTCPGVPERISYRFLANGVYARVNASFQAAFFTLHHEAESWRVIGNEIIGERRKRFGKFEALLGGRLHGTNTIAPIEHHLIRSLQHGVHHDPKRIVGGYTPGHRLEAQHQSLEFLQQDVVAFTGTPFALFLKCFPAFPCLPHPPLQPWPCEHE
ncbi:hypothetical protein UU7_00495 [Rhodanobacter spathiphylli B39]|uniref:Uncharacterized protein n=1 Tax=Rhodanobacter spathiphylli B39 TaxID=1163407 RepID=I4W7D1_9GAMM|nr:hypothetical protein UU7_00495 [Rhodanobacter spathiphylli B39]